MVVVHADIHGRAYERGDQGVEVGVASVVVAVDRAAQPGGVLPRWLSFVSYAVALLLLFVTNLSLWVTLVFPAWVFE